MGYLISSVLCSVAVSVLLKLAARRQVDVRQAIAMNYVVAASLAYFILQPAMHRLATPSWVWAEVAALGILLPTVFLAMARAVAQAGIVRSDAAQRLSLFIPIIAAFAIFGEALSGPKAAGLALAVAAMACLVGRPRPGMKGDVAPATTDAGQGWVWLLAVWVGYGTIDVLFKQVARAGTAFPITLLASFIVAGVLMLSYLTLTRTRWTRDGVIAGVLLGLLNFGNILFYIRAHQHFSDNPTLVFATMNIGVVALGTLTGALAFRERLSGWHIAGIVLAIGAIVVMMPR